MNFNTVIPSPALGWWLHQSSWQWLLLTEGVCCDLLSGDILSWSWLWWRSDFLTPETKDCCPAGADILSVGSAEHWDVFLAADDGGFGAP